MTWGSPPKFIPTKPKPGKVIQPEDLVTGSEDGEQAALFCWSALNVGKYPMLKWLHAIPNGGSRHIAEATKMVAGGLRKGVLDIFGPWPLYTSTIPDQSNPEGRGIIYKAGLYIELKIEKRRKEKNGGCSEEQIEWIDYLQQAGYYVKVCYGWEEARDTIVNYLEGKL